MKVQWVGLVSGVCIGALLTGGAWEVTHAMTKNGPVIATVGGNAIRRAAFDKAVDSTVGSQELATMIEETLIHDAAAKDKVYATSKEVDQMRAGFEQANGISSDAQLQSALAQSGLTLTQLNSEIKTEVLAQKVAEHDVKVTTKQIQTFYSKNKASFQVPAKVSISGIVLKTQAAANKAEAALSQGQTFATVAKALSTDATTKAKGGAMGTLSKTQLDPALQSIAFTMPLHTASQPVKTAAGWEIIEITARKAAYTKTLAQAKASIVEALKRQNAVSVTQLMANLAKTDKIVINNPAYAGVVAQIENPSSSLTP